jgi:hypothetical protein
MEDAYGILFISEGYLPIIWWKKKQPMSMKDEEWEILDRKALGTIQLFLAASMDFNISKENTMEDMMNTLDKIYEKPSISNKLFLMKLDYLI